MIFEEWQLQFLLSLKEIRAPLLDGLFVVLGFFDTPVFYLGLLAAIWIGFSRTWGIRIAYLEFATSFFNTAAKLYFGLPRPCHVLDLCLFFNPKSFGFPSGGAAASFIIGGVLILFWKNRWAWPLGAGYCLLISFSRMYLGVHYPIDILGGWLQGAIVLSLFYLFIRKLEPPMSRYIKWITLASILIPLLAWVSIENSQMKKIFEAALGTGIGIYFSRLYKHIPNLSTKPKAALCRALSGALSTLAILIFTQSPFLACLWMSWLNSFLFTRLI